MKTMKPTECAYYRKMRKPNKVKTKTKIKSMTTHHWHHYSVMAGLSQKRIREETNTLSQLPDH